MPKFNITLKNINPEEICKKYGIVTNNNIPMNSTIISDLTLRINIVKLWRVTGQYKL